MPCEGALGSLGKLISRSGLVIAYAACSASMLLVNKWALLHFPLPASLTFLQLASTAAVVVLVQLAGMVTIDEVSWAQVWAFMPVPMLFALALYSSTQLLHNSDAGLQILIRTTTPALVCVGDYLFMGYDLPSMRSMAALVGLMVGAAFYFRIETAISSSAIFWGCFYLVSISVEMVCVKSVLNHVRMGTWTRVLINNLITALILAPVCFLTDECARAAIAATTRMRAREREGAARASARVRELTRAAHARALARARRPRHPRVLVAAHLPPPIPFDGTGGKSSRSSSWARCGSRRSD
jgi:hypothetical protein